MITDLIALPIGEHLSETDDNSVAILLTYGTARVLLAGDEASDGVPPVGGYLQGKASLPQYAHEPLGDHQNVGPEALQQVLFPYTEDI